MRSAFADYFNHDDDSATYDQDVANEDHPIREGYKAALAWLGSQVPASSFVLDLGTGTGNTIAALSADCRVVGVDISAKMLSIARRKLRPRTVRFVRSDILEYFDHNDHLSYDAIVSSYAIHHLTDPEKLSLFRRIRGWLKPSGRAVFVDLMVRNETEKQLLRERYQFTCRQAFDGLNEEFFWSIEAAVRAMAELGFNTSLVQFSDLSWGITGDLQVREADSFRPSRDGPIPN